jgi:hypothetical protein
VEQTEQLASNLLEMDDEIRDLDPTVSAAAAKIKVGDRQGLSAPVAFLAKAAIKTLWRVAKGTNHDYFETLIEEVLRAPVSGGLCVGDIARAHWKTVKDHARESWATPETNGYQLLAAVAAEADKRPDNRPLRVDLMCHSAGSIMLCAAIDALERERMNWPRFGFGKLLFVAPAVQMRVFHEAVVSRHGKGYFESFRMFTLDDQHERADHLLGPLYANSLLFFVSGVAEEEGDGDMMLLGLHRHFMEGRRPYDSANFLTEKNIERFGDLSAIRAFLRKEGHVVLSRNSSSAPGRGADATGHENSKRPFKSPRLAASIVHFLSDEKYSPTETDIKGPEGQGK